MIKLDDTMEESLQALTTFLNSISKNELNQTLTKYEHYIDTTVVFKQHNQIIKEFKGKPVILAYYDGELGMYDHENNIFFHWINRLHKQEIWFVVINPNKDLIDKYFMYPRQATERDIITDKDSNTFIGIRKYGNDDVFEIVHKKPLTQENMKYMWALPENI